MPYDIFAVVGVIFCGFMLLRFGVAIFDLIFEDDEEENSEVMQCSQENVTYISSEKEK